MTLQNVSMTYILLAVIAGISIVAWRAENLQTQLLFEPYAIRHRKQYYRFLTSGFIHADLTHLLFNLFTLYFFGRNMEYLCTYLYGDLGYGYFLVLFLLGVIAANIPVFFKYRHNFNYRALGASGGVSAVVFSSIVFFPTEDICIYAVFCLPGFVLGALYLIYSYYSAKRNKDNIGHEAHFYGALFGVVFSFVIEPKAGLIFWDSLSNF